MEDLKQIGFYSLSDARVKGVSLISQMKRCEIIITEYCNFNCPYCRGLKEDIYSDRKIKALTLEEVKTNIDYWCKDIPLENIRFSGGEPTLHKNLLEMVSYAKEKGIKRIAISTNGSANLNLYRELVVCGVNDFSISLDGCCAEDIEKMSGGVRALDTISSNIKELSKITYVTVGIVITPDNIAKAIDTVYFASGLGVSDIRIIPSAQFDHPVEALRELNEKFLNRYPILKFRVEAMRVGGHVRGIKENDSPYCAIVLDDSVIAGRYHFPCVIYMREQGLPIGRVGPDMRVARKEWADSHNVYLDPICRKNCIDACVMHNNKYRELHPEITIKRRLPIL